MQARTRHQRGQALHAFQRRHFDVRGAVAPGALGLQHDIAGARAREPFVSDRRTRDVATQPFELLAPVRSTALRRRMNELLPLGLALKGLAITQ